MSTGNITPKPVTQKKDVVTKPTKLKDNFVDWLNGESQKKVSETESYKDLVDKKGLTDRMMKDEDLNKSRKSDALRRLSVERKRFSMIPTTTKVALTQSGKTHKDAFTDAYSTANSHILHQDLSIPENNNKANDLVDQVTRVVNAACWLTPGLGGILKDLVQLEQSAEYAEARRANYGTEVSDALSDLKQQAQKGLDVLKLGEKIRALQTKCRDIVLQQTETNKTIVTARNDHNSMKQTVDKAASEVKQYCNPFVERSNQLLEQAENLPVANFSNQAVKQYESAITNLLQQSKEQLQKIDNVVNGSQNLKGEEQKKFLQVIEIQSRIKKFGEGVGDQGCSQTQVDDALKLDHTADPQEVTDADNVAKALEAAVKLKQEAWEKQKIKSAALIRFMDKALASTAISDDQYVGTDTRRESAKELEKTALAAQAKYEEAIREALAFRYGRALELITGNEFAALENAQEKANDELGKAKVDSKVLEARKNAFSTVLGDITDKSRIRFDSEAMQIMQVTGIILDDDSDLTFSPQFIEMQKQLEIGLKLWHQLVDSGCDPFKSAEKAFEGIPENFWPPQAVRVIAMFRKAEAEFAGEREAAELKEGLQARPVVGVMLEVKQQAGELAGQAKDGMLAWFKEKFPGIKDSEVEKEAEKYFRDNNGINFKELSTAVGGLAAGLGAINGLFKVGTGAKDVDEARDKIDAYNPETDSPVTLRIAEFERNRAVWHLVNDLADTILSACGPATSLVPGLSALGDGKAFAISIHAAVTYFLRLKQVKATEKIARTDPESLADLALANEADKLGMLRNEKFFEAAIYAMKVLGAGLEAGGVTAAGGFGIKAGATILQYLGKALFTLLHWKDRNKAVKILMAARANPTDIEIVELVFEKCTMYSRFLLADGALNGDAWCRHYILSRGLTDQDLDNPNTSCAIIREYLNVSFQTYSGEAEEDDDLGTAKSEKKRKEALPSTEKDFGLWQPNSVVLEAKPFQDMTMEAKNFGLLEDKATTKLLSGLLSEYEEAVKSADSDMEEANEAYHAFVNDKKPETSKTALEKIRKALNSIAILGNTANECQNKFATYVPLSTTKDQNQKNKIHANYQTYLNEIADRIADGYVPYREFRNDASRSIMECEMVVSGSTENDVSKYTREKIAEYQEACKKILEKNLETIDNKLENLWKTIKIASEVAEDSDTIENLKSTLKSKMEKNFGENKAQDITKNFTTNFNEKFANIQKQLRYNARGNCTNLASELNTLIKDAEEKIKDQKALTKEMQRIERDFSKKVDSTVMSVITANAKRLLSEEFDEAANLAFEKTVSNQEKFQRAADKIELTRKFWVECKTELVEKHQWSFKKTGIGPQLESFEKAYKNWQFLRKDSQLQAEFNGISVNFSSASIIYPSFAKTAWPSPA